MRRREFITLLGGVAGAWPLAAYPQAGKLPTVGFLGGGTPSTWGPWTAAFVQRMIELGWIDGRTISVEYRWAEGRAERFAEIAAEFVRLNVNVIVASGTAVPALKQATTVIPIVFTLAVDPVASGWVASLARPGGNITGLSNQSADLVGKRLELLGEIVPGLRRIAILANGGNPGAVLEMDAVYSATSALGFEAIKVPIRSGQDIAPAFEALKSGPQALFVVSDSLVNTHRVRINTLAIAARLPTMHANREYVEAAGLMSYAANYPQQFRRAADYVDMILRGAKPAEIPVQQPTRFDLIINVTTAEALGLKIPPTLLARADEVIE